MSMDTTLEELSLNGLKHKLFQGELYRSIVSVRPKRLLEKLRQWFPGEGIQRALVNEILYLWK